MVQNSQITPQNNGLPTSKVTGIKIAFAHIRGWRHREHSPLYLSTECEAGFRLAVLFSEQLCVHGSGRELLWPSVLLSVSKNRRQGPENISSPSLSLSPTYPPFLSMQKYIPSIKHFKYIQKYDKQELGCYMDNAPGATANVFCRRNLNGLLKSDLHLCIF